MHSLARVGEGKPIGYLPLNTIHGVLELTIEAVRADTDLRGLDVIVFDAGQCCIKNGALYVFDREALKELLASSSELLVRNGWPADPDAFVHRIAAEWLKPTHPLMTMVQRAFGE